MGKPRLAGWGKFTMIWVKILESYGKFPMHLADAKWEGVSFHSRFWERPWLRALCGCMVSCFSHFPRRKASYLHIYTRFFFAVTRRICVFDRASLEMSWDVTVAFTYPSYLKGSRSKAPQEHICCLWGSKICEPLFYGCGSDKKSQNGSQWLDWLGCWATLFASIPVYFSIFYIFWIRIELVWSIIWLR